MKSTRSIVTAFALAVSLAAPAMTFARHGADDPAGDDRGGQKTKVAAKAAKASKAARPLRLSGSVGNDNAGVKARARYEERTKNSTIIKKFDVEITGAQAGQTFPVTVQGKLVGTVTINTLGRGELELRTTPDSPGDLPIPASFPSLKAGDTVQVGTLNITLAAR